MGFRSQSFRFEGWRETQYIGLKRTGKSCRLRWVNYLHPGLKRGKMTPTEERLVVDLQSKWGNRWSRIARKLPGRTDNEIKNYWRTHMRKKAQETKKKKKGISNPSSSSSSSSSSTSSSSSISKEAEDPIFYDTGGVGEKKAASLEVEDQGTKAYSMDDIWKEFEFEEDTCALTTQTVASPIWDYSLWSINEEETKMLMLQQPMAGAHHLFQSFPLYNYMIG